MLRKITRIIFSIFIISFTIYILLDTFVISNVYQVVNSTSSLSDLNNLSEEDNATITDNSYEDENISITIMTDRVNDTTIYVADIKLSNPLYLSTAFAKNSYGKNVTETTSNIASSVSAILAINGDFYGVQESGYVLKNGVIYRSTSNGNDDLVIYKDGSFEIINENNISIDELLQNGAYNILSFGPALIENSNISVNYNTEVGKSMQSNPRTAIGIIDTNHYVFVVSDGRTSKSAGLTLYELATYMKNLGCTTVYNLDGGGSSTMYFNGKVINEPTTTGNTITERKVSDIVYIGY